MPKHLVVTLQLSNRCASQRAAGPNALALALESHAPLGRASGSTSSYVVILNTVKDPSGRPPQAGGLGGCLRSPPSL